MKGTYSQYVCTQYVQVLLCIYMCTQQFIVLSQTGNDAELLVPELLKHITNIPLEKYQVYFNHRCIHILHSACCSYIGCLCHCIVGVYSSVYHSCTNIVTLQSPQDSCFPKGQNHYKLDFTADMYVVFSVMCTKMKLRTCTISSKQRCYQTQNTIVSSVLATLPAFTDPFCRVLFCTYLTHVPRIGTLQKSPRTT